MEQETEGLRLKLWLAKKIEDALVKLGHGSEGKVSAINFTFHNSWVLDMLREKGDYIKWQEWKKGSGTEISDILDRNRIASGHDRGWETPR